MAFQRPASGMSDSSLTDRAVSVAVLGTGSDVGKSLVSAGLCRLLHRAGIRVAPFKAQNMSLNSFVTPEGGEIGRAQALQAEACGVPPHVDMNPILLKPESDTCSQVVVQGKVFSSLDSRAYYDQRPDLFPHVRESFERLARQYDVIVIEGAGSAAEVNLRHLDLVNWPVVKLADSQVVLVADIDRGGVFAQVIGTLELLERDERERIAGIIINKFRGDAGLFASGVEFIEQRTGVPVLGVLPFVPDLMLEEEDRLGIKLNGQSAFKPTHVNVAIILIPHMSNFTDFDLLRQEHDVVLKYISSPDELVGVDVVILPGSKNAQTDLKYLLGQDFQTVLEEHVRQGGELIGICGGYQMLGLDIHDPHGVEGGGSSAGLGLLEIQTTLEREKMTTQVEAEALHFVGFSGIRVRGYHIHMGITRRQNERPCFHITRTVRNRAGLTGACADEEHSLDGAIHDGELVWGTYIHGVFDEPDFRRAWLNRVRRRKGLAPLAIDRSEAINAQRSHELDRWANHLQQYIRLRPIWDGLKRRGRPHADFQGLYEDRR